MASTVANDARAFRLGLATKWGRWGLALAAAAAGLTGCNSGFRAPEGMPGAPESMDDRRRDFPISNEDFAKLGYRMDWVGYPSVVTNASIIRMNVYSDIIALVDNATTVSVLEASTGRERWRMQLADRLTRIVGLSRIEGRILVSTDSEVLSLRVDTGDIVGRQSFEKVVNTDPVLWGDSAIYGTAVGELICHGLPLGLKKWGYGVNAAIDQPPVAVGDAVGLVTNQGDVAFVNAISGDPTTSGKKMFAGTSVPPISTGTLMVVASQDQSLYGYSPEADRAIWRVRTSKPLNTAPAYFNGVVYCEVEGSLTAFNSSNGKAKWTATGVQGAVVAARKGRLLVYGNEQITLVDMTDGSTVVTVPMKGVRRIVPEGFADGNLYLASKSGLVVKFNPH